jgi:hypothetical protein
MRFFRTAPSKPPSRLTRKADVGDVVVFRMDANGMALYWAHVGHQADVLDVQLWPQRHRPSPRAVYEVRCRECDMILHPRAAAFDVQ